MLREKIITWPLPTRGFYLPLFGMSTSVACSRLRDNRVREMKLKREHEDKTVENWGEEGLP